MTREQIPRESKNKSNSVLRQGNFAICLRNVLKCHENRFVLATSRLKWQRILLIDQVRHSSEKHRGFEPLIGRWCTHPLKEFLLPRTLHTRIARRKNGISYDATNRIRDVIIRITMQMMASRNTIQPIVITFSCPVKFHTKYLSDSLLLVDLQVFLEI